MKDTLVNFIGTVLVLLEIIGFILLIGTAGGVDQDVLSIGEGTKRILIIGGAMVLAGIALYGLIKNDDSE